MSIWIGVDVGGTFTDLVAFDLDKGAAKVTKVATSLPDQSHGILEAIERAGVDLADVDVMVHGTTTATNAILENRGATTGLLTTRGFRDLLELGRRTRPHLYGLGGSFKPLVPRGRRLEIDERIASDGSVIQPLDEDQVREAAVALREAGCESVAIAFLNSYAEDSHERRAAELVREVWPEAYVTESARILPQVREFERTTTAVLNATLQPLITRYIDRLKDNLADRGYTGLLYVVQANGGVMLADVTGERAVHTLLSGPAAGVTAAAQIGIEAGFPNVISGDMGGTSFDVATVRSGNTMITEDRELGFRLPLRIPAVDLITIGAGGGSLAYVDRGGLLKVGPESAGSYPGPICYGRGGDRPTLTDANLWLGRLDTTQIASLGQASDPEVVEKALRIHVAEPLGISVDEAAVAIVSVATNAMASAIRLVSIERGIDPREFAHVSFGGAGPLHALALADAASIPVVIIPARPGVTSALGCLIADVRLDRLQSVTGGAALLDLDELAAILNSLEADIREETAGNVLEDARVNLRYTLHMHYAGQFHVIPVEFDARPTDRDAIVKKFEATYQRLYGNVLVGRAVLVHTVGVSATSPRAETDLTLLAAVPVDEPEPRKRRAWFAGEWHDVPVLVRGAFGSEPRTGPLLVEQEDSTLVIEPGWTVHADRLGNLICRRTEA